MLCFRAAGREEPLPELLWQPEGRMMLLQCHQDAARPQPKSRQGLHLMVCRKEQALLWQLWQADNLQAVPAVLTECSRLLTGGRLNVCYWGFVGRDRPYRGSCGRLRTCNLCLQS